MSERTRDEHLAWAKARALAFLDAGDLKNAFTSMASDLSKHEAFCKPVYETLNQLGVMYLIYGDAHGLRDWINGFN